jgi:undecaprenyl phosphate N,N'-diacetylbacillosamine 1-phosphate transferase
MRQCGRVTYPGKRTLDLALAGVASIVFAPVVAVIALAIWLDDRGSPFFRQIRIGQARRPFSILKFRTMRDGAVTRVGRWLRHTGLDELPQFANVCRGDMSVVGPRPLTQEDIERLGWCSSRHDWRFDSKPGITGSAQLAGGRSARDSSRLERLYLRKQSITLDVCIVALSFAINVIGKAAVRKWIRPRRCG